MPRRARACAADDVCCRWPRWAIYARPPLERATVRDPKRGLGRSFAEWAHEALAVKLRDKAFQRAFSRLFVYNILWEDAEVDERFLGVGEDSSILAITGAGCGVAGLVSRRPVRIDAADINAHHLALSALKVTAAQRMQNYTEFYDMFGRGWHVNPDKAVGKLVGHLPRWMQRYWRRHSGRFERSLYTRGLTAQFLTTLRKRAGLDAEWLRDIIKQPMERRDMLMEDAFRPMLTHPAVKAFINSPIQLLALGVNYEQRDRMLEQEQTDMVGFFMQHIKKLGRTDLETNWFVWWVIANHFNHEKQEAVPPYLRRDRHERSYDAPTLVRYHRRNIFDVLEEAGPKTWSHYMFCDAPDWMPEPTQRRLLQDVFRTSRDGAIVLYRSVEDDCMVRRLGLEKQFQPLEEESKIAAELDRTKQYRRVNFYRVQH